MAGVITHLIAGSSLLTKQKMVSEEYYGCFLLGSCFPDAGYFPGENSLISDLAHYLMAARIPYYLYQNTDSECWKAFASGWLFHLQTDLALHPLVNKFAAQYHFGVDDKNQIYTFEQNPQIHALIENELDSKLLDVSAIKHLNLASPVLSRENPVALALEDIYSLKFDSKYLDKLLIKLPEKLKLFYGSLNWLKKMKLLKHFSLGILSLLRKFISEPKYILIKNFFKPEQINDEKFLVYKQAIAELIEKVSQHDSPQWFTSDYNFDTGSISEFGEYGLADHLFAEIDSNKNNNTLWKNFREQFIHKKGNQ
ncbi:MAG: zinc dependent phospholipase C family protein [Candidatus Cloacimonetes bacterium]|nr:zinc dependent phospholipase C family protein [Candidatus Cloacimonadota bacterium]